MERLPRKKVKILDDLHRTSETHSCHTRMYELKGKILEVISKGTRTVTVYDPDFDHGNGRQWMFHPRDVEFVEISEEKSEPVLFDVNNLM